MAVLVEAGAIAAVLLPLDVDVGAGAVEGPAVIGADMPPRVAAQLLHQAHAFVRTGVHEAAQLALAVPADHDRHAADGAGEIVVRIFGLGRQAHEHPAAFEHVLHFQIKQSRIAKQRAIDAKHAVLRAVVDQIAKGEALCHSSLMAVIR